ncbi:MAG: sugar phosphate isomerase/epimerase [Anaerolineae bacterium]|nr:sugar phosphate isomerase/epimerase [Anaerolineae bacterium]
MVRYGAHAFVWIPEWNVETGNYAIEQAAKTGFDFLEVPIFRPERFDAKAAAAALKKHNLASTVSLVLPPGKHMAHHPEEALRFLYAVMDKMAEMECTYLTGCIAFEIAMKTGAPPTAEERRVTVETLKVLAAEAKRRGITLGLEPVNRYEGYMYNVLEDGRDCIKAVGADNLKLHADTYHMNIEEEGFYKPIIATADVLDYVHMSESHRGLVGSGTVNWDQIWQALGEIKFKGHLVLESFAAINEDLAQATCLWRPSPYSSERIATEGLAFLKEGAARVGIA